MVFSSLIFIYVFLPLQLLFYYFTPVKYKNSMLLFFSLLFYSWSGPLYLLILLGDSFVAYWCAKKIESSSHTNPFATVNDINQDKKCKFYLALCTVTLLMVLVFFKYLGFLSDIINKSLGYAGIGSIPVVKIALPIGISFYTFQLISYVVDVYRKEVHANTSYGKVLLYASLFHQCIAGPIVRYKQVADEIDYRTTNYKEVFYGVKRFSIGLAKKAILANSCAKIADQFLANNSSVLGSQSVAGLWLGAFCYTLQIYLDFSAYSDMAIGMGQMIGFHYLENFNYPYISRSVKEFWRRWHISLSSFFRDYVFIPLGGSRVKPLRHIFNLLVVWFLTGLWHGASTNFIMWGLYYFVLLLIEKYIFRNKTIPVIGNIYTMFAVILGWVLFKFDSFANLKTALYGLFGQNCNKMIDLQTKTVFKGNAFLLLFCILACTPLFKKLGELLHSHSKENTTIAHRILNSIGALTDIIIPAALLLLSTFALVGNSYNPFLYFRF